MPWLGIKGVERKELDMLGNLKLKIYTEDSYAKVFPMYAS